MSGRLVRLRVNVTPEPEALEPVIEPWMTVPVSSLNATVGSCAE